MDKCFGSKAVDGAAAQPLRRPQAVRMEGMLRSEDVYMEHCRDDSGMMMINRGSRCYRILQGCTAVRFYVDAGCLGHGFHWPAGLQKYSGKARLQLGAS